MQKEFIYHSSPISYQVHGEGIPVVLIHGFAEDSNVWKYQINPPYPKSPLPPFIRGIKGECKLIIPDLPGSGKSPLVEQLTIESMAEAVRAILQEEAVTSCIMIGHSMGGYVTLAFAEKYPELLKAFGLFHSTAYPDTDEKKEIRQKSIQFIRQHGSYEFLKQSSPNTFGNNYKQEHPEKVEELINMYKDSNPEALIAYYKVMMQRPDRTVILKQFPRPVLFIIGAQDNAVPLNDSLQQCHLPDFSYIHILKNSGHMGMWEETDRANELLLQFIKNVST